jgi:predicted RNA-binding Zn ribbon-like protein
MSGEHRPTAQPVRFGGSRTPDGYLFELTGGHLCLDLANTLDERQAAEPRELLTDFRDLLDWGVQSGTIDAGQGRVLRALAAAHPRRAEQALRNARAVRESIYAVFSSVATRVPVPAAALSDLNGAFRQAVRHRSLASRDGAFAWTWVAGARASLDQPLWPAVWAAGELLVSGDLARVKQCEGAGCGWLFLDTSRNGSRRWCDMSVCGNRAKARRHYARSRDNGDRRKQDRPARF